MSLTSTRFELDPTVRRRDRGRLLAGGTPPRLIRLSDSGCAALDAILAGAPLGSPELALAIRLERHGMIHPLPAKDADDPPVTAVIPVLDGGENLVELVRGLLAEGPVIVVDDGSSDGSAERAAAAGARVLSNVGRRGPAAARNTGLRAADTDLVAFIDADCSVRPGWRAGLAGLLAADSTLALIAPRVRSVQGHSLLARYERGSSPLDLGPRPSLVGPRRRIAYLPAAALLGRRADLLELEGFDESLRFGEDVDLVWRLLKSGRRARYAPSRQVLHAPRATARALAIQRVGYGGSAPGLARRHGRSAAPVQAGPQIAAVWLAGLAFGPRALAPGVAASTVLVVCRGRDRGSSLALVGLSLRGNAVATRHLARALSREWLPGMLALATFDRRARGLLLAALTLDAAPAWRRSTSPRDFLAITALRCLDNASFAAGLWIESVRRREARALLPWIVTPSAD